jgi:hypothetical protein
MGNPIIIICDGKGGVEIPLQPDLMTEFIMDLIEAESGISQDTRTVTEVPYKM